MVADIETTLETGPTLRRSVLQALAGALAGAAAAAHGHIDWVARQIMPDTSDGEYLERQAELYGVARKPGTYASGKVTMTGANGTVVPLGTIVQLGPVQYGTTAEGVVVAGTLSVAVEALEPGTAGNLSPAVSLVLLRPVAGMHQGATVGVAGLSGGDDPESDESLRARLLERMQSPPRGGVAADYVAWAKEVAGVTRAWAIPNHQGVGTVGLTFVRDKDSGEDEIPNQAEVDEVQAYVDEKRPIGAQLVVFAPALQLVDFELTVTPDTPTLRAAVEKSLADLLSRASEPGAEILVSHVHEVISSTTNERDHTLIAPVANVQLAAGAIAKLGVVTW